MKKTLRISGVIALVVVVAACLVACTPIDLNAAKEKMEDAGYRVKSLETSKLEKYGISLQHVNGVIGAVNTNFSSSLTDRFGDIADYVMDHFFDEMYVTILSNLIGGQFLIAIQFDSPISAQSAYETLSDKLSFLISDDSDNRNVQRTGSWVLLGTGPAIKAFVA